ncbi:MAG: J domain-containing protein [Actinomycetota bacterium]|nr:J domain-containing protein [Actinomycetota bacterium]
MADHRGSLYDLLGVAPQAPADEIRQAYRRQARAHHPDRHGDGRADRMAEINHAWSVLGDPARRREYDRSLPAAESFGTEPLPFGAEPFGAERPAWSPLDRYMDPPRIPWRFMGVLLVLGLAFVAFGVATAGQSPRRPIDNVLHPGECVVLEPNGDAAEASCDQPHDGVVVEFLTDDTLCPAGTEAHRDRQGMGTACVRLG